MKEYIQAFKQYAQFSGRSRRKDFWIFILIHTIIITVLNSVLIVTAMSNLSTANSGSWSDVTFSYMIPLIVLIGYVLAVIIPLLAVLVRRLHDTNRSGWNYFFVLIPVVGAIILLVFLASDSTPGDNQYGANPKLVA